MQAQRAMRSVAVRLAAVFLVADLLTEGAGRLPCSFKHNLVQQIVGPVCCVSQTICKYACIPKDPDLNVVLLSADFHDQCGSYFKGVTYWGPNIGDAAIASDVQDCCQQCLKRPGCLAFTYDTAPELIGKAVCFLKYIPQACDSAHVDHNNDSGFTRDYHGPVPPQC